MFNEKASKRRLMLLSVVICIIPVLILYFINEKKFEELSLAELETENNQVANAVDKELAKMRQTVLLLANNPAWEKYYTEPERKEYWKEQQVKAFQYVKEQIPETDEACFLDDTHNGAEVVRVDEVVAHSHDLSPSEKAQPFYQAAMAVNRGEVYQSMPYVSADSRRWVFGNVTPVVIQEDGPSKGKKVGLIHYEVNLSYLSNELIDSENNDFEAFVVNNTGDLIASSDEEKRDSIAATVVKANDLSEEEFAEFQGAVMLPQVNELTGNSELWDQIKNTTNGTHVIQKDGKDYFVAYENVKFSDDMNWVVGLIKPVPRNAFLSFSNVLMYVTFLILFLFILGAWGIINKIFNEINGYQKDLTKQAHYDALTELPNRVLFQKQVDKLIDSIKNEKNNKAFAVLFIDLDRFKIINDTMGHSTGDSLLKEVAGRLKNCITDTAIVSRFGGDEFTVLFSDIKSKKAVHDMAREINETILKPFLLKNNEYYISTSIGISMYPVDGSNSELLIKNADIAMYKAKESGKSNYVFYQNEFNHQPIRRLQLENNIRKALELEEFQVYYQPKLTMPNEEVGGMEALIRWFHPEMGTISPSEFIPLAEETGLINPIGKWVLREACIQNKKWQDEGLPPVVMAINISAYQFHYGSLVQTVTEVLKETGLEGQWLELELTESLLINNEEYVLKAIESLKKLGIKISIDDFGTGYSSLSYLKRFPIDTIKIDRSFIKDIVDKKEMKSITQAIITMGHGLGCKLVAEGVETEEQKVLLETYKVDQIQGYYYSAAVSKEHATEMIRSNCFFQLRDENKQA
ncbi:diguanylate cyclase/phosphodiesterase with PAS/PAC sensor(s) [Planococcus donghaensis MPA1U2]|uniref:Diguanylate cyclase/phosphodiesterase with PAS/PAC sensor(S) n=1 Tax=Planococcus donghaensis MPA1U2 TaxID=933115 RepID=E7RCA0_9BACL|nr:EAL domain-containing protein [Planococcus donghaensis]EGA91265.1 diguanylate cyclase/phosphodiesterase with PAS/PAC sensor(s) [Planococcus donghaensis MPA1U2]